METIICQLLRRDRLRSGNHESGHAFSQWAHGRTGRAKLWQSCDRFGETTSGEFIFKGGLLPIFAVAGVVAECMFDAHQPIRHTDGIIALWQRCDEIVSRIDAAPKLLPLSGYRPRLDDPMVVSPKRPPINDRSIRRWLIN